MESASNGRRGPEIVKDYERAEVDSAHDTHILFFFFLFAYFTCAFMKGVDIMLENKKSFKEVVKEHKYQIIAGAACITTGVVSYLLFKEIKKNNSVNDVQETLQVIQAAMSEGMVQEAIATTTRKYNVRMDKIDHLTSKCKLKYDEQKKLEKAMAEAAVFKRRIEAYRKVESKYFIEE